MIKYYRKIILCNSKLKGGFRFENKFQILPIEMNGKPQSPYARDIPLFLEYTIEYPNDELNDIFEIEAIRLNKEKEILNLLSCHST